MTLSPRQSPGSSGLPDVVAQLQGRIETLYLSGKALECDVIALRATGPVLLRRAGRPSWVIRLLKRYFPGLRRHHDARVIRDCGLFERQWYLETYPDVARAGQDPAAHFLVSGAGEKRNPGPYFDTGHYLRLYPDIARTGLNPLLHYLIAGFDEGRSIRPGMAGMGAPVRGEGL